MVTLWVILCKFHGWATYSIHLSRPGNFYGKSNVPHYFTCTCTWSGDGAMRPGEPAGFGWLTGGRPCRFTRSHRASLGLGLLSCEFGLFRDSLTTHTFVAGGQLWQPLVKLLVLPYQRQGVLTLLSFLSHNWHRLWDQSTNKSIINCNQRTVIPVVILYIIPDPPSSVDGLPPPQAIQGFDHYIANSPTRNIEKIELRVWTCAFWDS